MKKLVALLLVVMMFISGTALADFPLTTEPVTLKFLSRTPSFYPGQDFENVDNMKAYEAMTGIDIVYDNYDPSVFSNTLAGVIAMQPQILILDEPAAGLDPGGRREILGGVKRYARESGTNVIIVSHSMEDMALYCDDLVVMSAGKILMYDTCAAVFSRAEEMLAVGLDVPQVTSVAFALAKHGVDIGRDVYTVDWAADKIAAFER